MYLGKYIKSGRKKVKGQGKKGRFKLLRPKRAIKHKTQPASRLPGVCTDDGEWLTGGKALSVMWQRHFGKIENAEEGCPGHLGPLPTFSPGDYGGYAFSSTNPIRPGTFYARCQPPEGGWTGSNWSRSVEGQHPRQRSRCFALFLKSGLRQQWVATFAGGDLIPLYKKGDAARPSNYRAILLEPTLGGHVWWRHYNWFRHLCSLVDMNR